MSDQPGAHAIVRMFLAVATWGSLGIALLVEDSRWFVASGAFGTLWFLVDVMMAKVLGPMAGFLGQLLRGEAGFPPASARPTVDDTIRLLEGHLENNAARGVQVQSALRLSDLYRVVYRDEARAAAVLAMVRQRFPDAAELGPSDPSVREE